MNDKKIKNSPVMHPPFDEIPRLNFSRGFDPQKLLEGWGIGGYNEKRPGMYLAPQYKNERNIHMGVDIWASAGEPVCAPLPGIVLYTANNSEDGNYGGTVVLKHSVGSEEFFALYGHLSLKSLEQSVPGKRVEAGELVGWLGERSENGNWHPHLHYQVSTEDPGEADMPGVVSESNRETALKKYPDPEKVIGRLV